MAGGPTLLLFKLHNDVDATTLVTYHTWVLYTQKKITFPWYWSSSWNCMWKINICVWLELYLYTEKHTVVAEEISGLIRIFIAAQTPGIFIKDFSFRQQSSQWE